MYFLAQDHYFDREQLYGTADGDYWDNCERFVFFCRAGLEAVARLADAETDGAAWRPQIVHANDWQTGLVPSTSRRSTATIRPWRRSLATVFTIHNLAYQGVFWHYDMPMTGLGWDLFTPAGLEFYGNLNFLKGGLVFSDLLTTVSRTYAREIRTPAFGGGLEGVLEERSHDLHGVVNGIDYDAVESGEGPGHRAPYSADDPDGKPACREALRAELGLERGPGPVIGLVTRLVEQKGVDLVLERVARAARGGRAARRARIGRRAPRRRRSARRRGASRPGRRPPRVRRRPRPPDLRGRRRCS